MLFSKEKKKKKKTRIKLETQTQVFFSTIEMNTKGVPLPGAWDMWSPWESGLMPLVNERFSPSSLIYKQIETSSPG